MTRKIDATCSPCKINTRIDDADTAKSLGHGQDGYVVDGGVGPKRDKRGQKRQTDNYKRRPEGERDQASENVTPERSGSGRYYCRCKEKYEASNGAQELWRAVADEDIKS